MFINNKYTDTYISLIAQALTRDLDGSTYTEKHHIIPKCMGGPDTPNNLVRLTAKEHYIAHLLLTKMTEGVYKRKMTFALWRMTQDTKKRNSRHKLSAAQYDTVKRQMAENIRIQNQGQRLTPEQQERQKAGMARNGGPWNKGKQMSEESRAKMRKTKLRSKSSPDTKAKISAGIKKWYETRKSESPNSLSPSALSGRQIPRYTSVIEHKSTGEQFTTAHLREWLSERGLKPHHLHFDRCDYVVVKRFITRTGKEIPVKRL